MSSFSFYVNFLHVLKFYFRNHKTTYLTQRRKNLSKVIKGTIEEHVESIDDVKKIIGYKSQEIEENDNWLE